MLSLAWVWESLRSLGIRIGELHVEIWEEGSTKCLLTPVCVNKALEVLPARGLPGHAKVVLSLVEN